MLLLYQIIRNINYAVKANRTMFYLFKLNKQILSFLNILWRSGFIFGYKFINKTVYLNRKKQPKLLVYLCLRRNSLLTTLSWLSAFSTYGLFYTFSNRRLLAEISKKNYQVVFLLLTPFGMLSSDEILLFNLSTGGRVFCSALA